MVDTKIYVITCMEKNKFTHRMEEIVSHGVGDSTLKNYILSNETLREYVAAGTIKHDSNGDPYIPIEEPPA